MTVVSSDSGDRPVPAIIASDTAPLTTRDASAPSLNGARPALARVDAVPDAGLYAILGVSATASDAEVQIAYRRKAARLATSRGRSGRELRQLNAAYEVLGNPTRRAEYDLASQVTLPVITPQRPTGVEVPFQAAPTPASPRHRTGRAAPGSNGGLPEIVAVLLVVGLAVGAVVFLIPRIPINLSALNALGSVLAVGPAPRRVAIEPVTAPEATPTLAAAPTATAVATAPPVAAADRFSGTTVAVLIPSPAPFSTETVVAKLRRDGAPAPDVDIWATVQYRTAQERWPATGTVKTDATGTATITFNVGPATAGYPVQVHVFTQADGQQPSWSTSFTPG